MFEALFVVLEIPIMGTGVLYVVGVICYNKTIGNILRRVAVLIVLLVLGLVLLIISGVRYWQRGKFHWITAVIGVILVVVMGVGVHLAKTQHFGMSKVPVSTTQKIEPATTLLGYKIIATNNSHTSAEVYTYQRNGKTYQTIDSNKKPTINQIDGEKGTLRTTLNTYQVTNPWQQILLVGMSTMVKGEGYTKLDLPKDWYVINQKDLAADQKYVQDQKKQIPDKVATETAKQLQDAANSDSSILTDKDKQKALQDKVVAEVQSQVDEATKQALQTKLDQQNELK
ncbi:DUF4811 domain-containing protein [Weissella muntiaci]|uniref:DUF4811 domain-containing protein n=1 Tax=Weissella muntiaci TaxID=2508881 RepID=A0A6C2C509_9LACO|nr:DUF4811 domain-containing protein [Weissella muntiaci]TYC48974.1 DUF4811 domain-containing protein [Weissella muntiaci]